MLHESERFHLIDDGLREGGSFDKGDNSLFDFFLQIFPQLEPELVEFRGKER